MAVPKRKDKVMHSSKAFMVLAGFIGATITHIPTGEAFPSKSATILAHAQVGQTGISASFRRIQAVEGQKLDVYVSVSDQLQVIQQIDIFYRVSGQLEKTRFAATLSDFTVGPKERIWHASIPAERIPPALTTIELSAHLLTKRGGLVLSLGEPEPFDAQVLSSQRAQKEKAVFAKLNQELQGDFPFVGGIGLEAKAPNAARMRAILSGAGKLNRRWDLGIKISLGPKLNPPDVLQTPSPLLLGIEVNGRRRVASKSLIGFDIFSELYSNIDLSLPGADLHSGLRVGASIALAGAARLDLGLGGGLGWFRVNEEQPFFGLSGGLQSILWFGDTNDASSSKSFTVP